MSDSVWKAFLERQLEAGAALAAGSDVLELHPLAEPAGPPTRYLARFKCKGVLRDADGQVALADSLFTVGISLREDHLRHVDPLKVVTWLDPPNIIHPNVSPPFVCVGHVFPGVELVDLLFSVYEMICYFNWASGDAVHAEAAEWARRHQHLFPIECRPLRRPTRQREAGNAGNQGGTS